MSNARIYIDGFNLYNGCIKGTAFKWLDLVAMCKVLLPGRTIQAVRYFTARVVAFPHDPDAPTRQDVYLRALKTFHPLVTIDEGWFAPRPTLLPQFPLVYPDPTKPPIMVRVQRMEEKRTDVNIATRILTDCFFEPFDELVLISNDSDLVLPLTIARTKFNKRITVVNPHHRNKMSGHLARVADQHLRSINKKVLATCQLPPTMADAKGTFHKPLPW